jgi:hypothetical protein
VETPPPQAGRPDIGRQRQRHRLVGEAPVEQVVRDEDHVRVRPEGPGLLQDVELAGQMERVQGRLGLQLLQDPVSGELRGDEGRAAVHDPVGDDLGRQCPAGHGVGHGVEGGLPTAGHVGVLHRRARAGDGHPAGLPV